MKQTITVLLIEDDPDYAALVKAWLAQNVEVNFDVNWTNTLSAGIYRLAEGGIDVALLDLSLPDSEGPQTFRALQKRARTVPVILLSGNDRESLAFDLIGSGAQDYLVKSRCSPEVLSRSILYSLLRHPRGEKQADEDSSAKVVDVLSAKGGVGVTTLACNLAASLQRQEKQKVLLIDLDVHANQTAFLFGAKPSYTLLDALSNADRLDESALSSVVTEVEGGLHLLPSPALHGQSEPCVEKIQDLLYRLSGHYAWIVLDLGRLAGGALALQPICYRTIAVSSTALSSLYETRRAFAALQEAGCDEDQLTLAVSELPGIPRLADDALGEMVGVPVGLRLKESSSDLKSRGRSNGLAAAGCNYARLVDGFARTLTGAPAESESSKGLAQRLGFSKSSAAS